MPPERAQSDSSYPDACNPDLLSRIPLAARTVLDVGCHTGALGAAYRRLNPSAILLGIEADPAAAAIAATRLDDVRAVDLEADPMPFALPAGLDCLILGDVLEHLRDPWSILAHQAEALAEDGTLLLCVPNVEHWSFLARLLRGDWDYQDSGLLDRSHLRWFTRRTVTEGLKRLGLHVCDVTPRIFDPASGRAFLDGLAPALEKLGIDPAGHAARALPLQYVWRAQKSPRPRLHVAATMLRPVGGVSDVRIVYPQAAIATDPTVFTHVGAVADFPKLPPEAPKIAVLHRPVLAGESGLTLLRGLLSENWVIVTEFDDHPDHFPAMRAPDQYAFTGVHAVQTTTEPLAAILRARNPEVAVFPNAIRALPEVCNFANPDHTTLFFGALNREDDWHGLIGALNDVANRAGPRLRFEVVHDKAFHDALATPHKRFTPTCDHETYLRLLGGCEIALMPLNDTPFNRAKSDLKFIEAAACRAVPLASPVVYAASIQDGRTGALFHNASELRTRLSELIAYPDMARIIAEAARAHVAADRMLAGQVARRIAWYRDLWARGDALGDRVWKRLGGLR